MSILCFCYDINLLFCCSVKSGNTEIRKYFSKILEILGDFDSTNETLSGQLFANKYRVKKIEYSFEDYLRVLFVRNVYSRLVSAYIQHIRTYNERTFCDINGEKIYWSNFEDFINLLYDKYKNKNPNIKFYDGHFLPMTFVNYNHDSVDYIYDYYENFDLQKLDITITFDKVIDINNIEEIENVKVHIINYLSKNNNLNNNSNITTEKIAKIKNIKIERQHNHHILYNNNNLQSVWLINKSHFIKNTPPNYKYFYNENIAKKIREIYISDFKLLEKYNIYYDYK